MCLLCIYGDRDLHEPRGLNYIGSNYSISVEDSFSGNLSLGDRDWVGITLNAGTSYVFNLTGSTSGDGTLSDPFLRLYDSNGSFLTLNDDGGSGAESRILFTASNTGTYYLSAGSYLDRSSGSYLLSSEVAISTVRDFGDFAPKADLSSSDYWSGIDQNNEFLLGLKWINGAKWGGSSPETTTTALNYYIYDNERTIGQYDRTSVG